MAAQPGNHNDVKKFDEKELEEKPAKADPEEALSENEGVSSFD